MRNAACIVMAALLLASGADGASTAADYFVFTLASGGRLTATFAATVTLEGDLIGRSIAGGGTIAGRDADAIAIRLRDAAGRVVFRDVVEVPRMLRGEFHGASGGLIDGHLHALGIRHFVVRVPALDAGTLEITAPAARRPTRFDVDELRRSLAPPAMHAAAEPSRRAARLDGWSNGDAANRVDLLVLGDGFTASQEALFAGAALEVVEGMFSISPYADYHNYVNATAIFTPSLEEGADQPPYDAGCTDYGFNQECCRDTSAIGQTPRFVSTAFDASYCTLDIQRLLTVDASKIFTVAATVPDWDQIIVIVNASVYGGSGGGLSVISMHGSAIEIAQHEYGHTFAALADEYTSAYPGYPACSDADAQMPRCERNVTDVSVRESIKWAKWIDPLQPVPSIDPPSVTTAAGLWQGARYRSSGMYRQGHTCIMRALGAPFCDVAAEAYVLRLYEGGWGTPLGGIDVVEPGSEIPPPGDVVVPDPGATFAARVLGPAGGPGLDVRWLLDGVEVSTSSAESGALVSYTLETAPGLHTVQLRVTDVSPLLHATTRPALARTRTWNVRVQPIATTTLPASTTTTTLAVSTTTTTSQPTTSQPTTTSTVTTTSTTLPATTSTTMPAGTTTTTVSGATTTSTTLALEPLCARPVSGGDVPVATDCLFLLNAAVGLVSCVPECACAPKGVLPVSATDALVCLNVAVGGPVELRCPCGPLP